MARYSFLVFGNDSRRTSIGFCGQKNSYRGRDIHNGIFLVFHQDYANNLNKLFPAQINIKAFISNDTISKTVDQQCEIKLETKSPSVSSPTGSSINAQQSNTTHI